EWSGNWFPDATRKPASVRVRSSISREDRSPHDIAYITSVASICGSYPGRPRTPLAPRRGARGPARPRRAPAGARAGRQGRGVELLDHVNQEPGKMVL